MQSPLQQSQQAVVASKVVVCRSDHKCTCQALLVHFRSSSPALKFENSMSVIIITRLSSPLSNNYYTSYPTIANILLADPSLTSRITDTPCHHQVRHLGTISISDFHFNTASMNFACTFSQHSPATCPGQG